MLNREFNYKSACYEESDRFYIRFQSATFEDTELID